MVRTARSPSDCDIKGALGDHLRQRHIKTYFEKMLLYIPVCHECFRNTAKLFEEPLSQLLSDLLSCPMKSVRERRGRKKLNA